ncbi:MAG: Gfo/Idh/MocA family oxidoreductase [Lentisphaerae bacterium]|nr:Gfo/Idh/MocA family oxidoreductase [Lentisphaerota bacterium]
MEPVKMLVLGAGGRGGVYADFVANNPDKAAVVGVAEPRDFYRNRIAAAHRIPEDRVFRSWEQAAALPRFADAVLICTQDSMHTAPALAFARRKYHILLEKPMAPTEPECRRIVEAVKRNKVILAVSHVMRYTRPVQNVKRLLRSGVIGEIASLQDLEGVTYWHQAHSYVRGHWRNEKESSFMLLAKSCHYLDAISYYMGSPCAKVSSFGNLKHFRGENKPRGAAMRCMDCPRSVESKCPYSARRFYLNRVKLQKIGWPVNVLSPDPTEKSISEALRKGPYGRCVYACDNDVVDHQVVNMEFANGATAVHTMTAFTPEADMGPKLRIFGTRGMLCLKGSQIQVFDFLTDTSKIYDASKFVSDAAKCDEGAHGGGDGGLMTQFIEAVQTGDQGKLLTGPDETLESHRIVFAAERSRRTGSIVKIPALSGGGLTNAQKRVLLCRFNARKTENETKLSAI